MTLILILLFPFMGLGEPRQYEIMPGPKLGPVTLEIKDTSFVPVELIEEVITIAESHPEIRGTLTRKYESGRAEFLGNVEIQSTRIRSYPKGIQLRLVVSFQAKTGPGVIKLDYSLNETEVVIYDMWFASDRGDLIDIIIPKESQLESPDSQTIDILGDVFDEEDISFDLIEQMLPSRRKGGGKYRAPIYRGSVDYVGDARYDGRQVSFRRYSFLKEVEGLILCYWPTRHGRLSLVLLYRKEEQDHESFELSTDERKLEAWAFKSSEPLSWDRLEGFLASTRQEKLGVLNAQPLTGTVSILMQEGHIETVTFSLRGVRPIQEMRWSPRFDGEVRIEEVRHIPSPLDYK